MDPRGPTSGRSSLINFARSFSTDFGNYLEEMFALLDEDEFKLIHWKEQDSPGSGKPLKAKPTAEGNSDIASNDTPSACGEVVLATGEKYLTQPDFRSLKTNGLSLTRTYRSKSTRGYFFGPNWTTCFDPIHITISQGACIPTESGCYPPDLSVAYP